MYSCTGPSCPWFWTNFYSSTYPSTLSLCCLSDYSKCYEKKISKMCTCFCPWTHLSYNLMTDLFFSWRFSVENLISFTVRPLTSSYDVSWNFLWELQLSLKFIIKRQKFHAVKLFELVFFLNEILSLFFGARHWTNFRTILSLN